MRKPEPGTRVGEFVLLRPLGKGGYGAVWAARAPAGQTVALKLISRLTKTARGRFLREVDALLRLDHPHCVRIIGSGATEEGTPFLVMPLLEGETLSNWARGRSVDEIRAAGAQIASALRHAHSQDMLHRDVKPSNVIVLKGPKLNVQVLDFGLARFSDSHTITDDGEPLGTPGFMSPEQMLGRPTTPATDAYGLGATLYAVLEGKPMWHGKAIIEIAQAQLAGTPSLTRDVPRDLASLLQKLLDPDPERRPSLAEVEARLQPAAPSTQAIRASKPARILAVIAAGLATVLLGAFVMKRATDDNRATVSRPATRVGGLIESNRPADTPPAAERESGLEPTGPCGGTGQDKKQFWIRADNGTRALMVLPYNYQATKTPLVLAFHSGASSPRSIVEETSLVRWVNQYGIAVLLPHDPPSMERKLVGTWGSPAAIEGARSALERANEEVCVDQQRIYLLGAGSGGTALRRLICELGQVRAAATLYSRPAVGMVECRPPEPVPRLILSPLESKWTPIAAGPRACDKLSLDTLTSLDDHEHRVRSDAHCAREEAVESDQEHARCKTWACPAEVVSCRVEGGEPTTHLDVECYGPPPEFDYYEAAFEFFDRHAAPAKSGTK